MDVYGGEFDDYVFLILVAAEAEDDPPRWTVARCNKYNSSC